MVPGKPCWLTVSNYLNGCPSPGSDKRDCEGTLDRLQRSIGRKQALTVNFAFNPSIGAQATSQAMLKTLLFELIESAVGNLG